MSTRKTSKTKSSSGPDPKSKKIVKKKVGDAMHEFKRHELESGRSGKKVTNPKQAIAIGLSAARRSGANIPADPNPKKAARKGALKSRGSEIKGEREEKVMDLIILTLRLN